jgi:Holliday junction resolvase
MEIKKVALENFVKLISVSGDYEINEAIFNIKEDSINTIVVSSNKVVAIKGRLNGEFKPNVVGIDSLALLKKVIAKSDDEMVEVNVKSNKLNINAGKNFKASCILRSPETIMNSIEENKFLGVLAKTKNSFSIKLDSAKVKSIVSYLKSFGAKDVIITSNNDKKLNFRFEVNENVFDYNVDIEEDVKFESIMNEAFLRVIETINEDDVELRVKNDLPLYLSIVNDDYVLEYLIAPKTKE